MIERYTTKEMRELWNEEERFHYWLRVEIAVAWAQSRMKKIPVQAYEVIKKAKFDTAQIAEFERETRHDVIAFLKSVEESIGDQSRFLHFGLTSYDIVDTALALQTVKACDIILKELRLLEKVILGLAKRYKTTPMMGRTHSVHAQPITFGLKCLSWFEEIKRGRERLERAKENVSFGKISGAVGTYSQIPPKVEELALKKLGLKPEPVATQVVPRDRLAELFTVLAIIGSGLERIATEIRSLQRTEIGEVEEPFYKGQRGSSAMPHKRNPIICERVSGLARVVRGNALASLENINLWNERDISNSSVERIILPDSTILVHYCCRLMIGVLKGLSVYPKKMLENIDKSHGLFFSQSLWDAMIKKGMGRDESYKLVQSLSFQAQKESRSLKEVAFENNQVKERFSRVEIEKIFDLSSMLKNIDYIFKKSTRKS
jgi:adenylosuccinate lyase